MKNVNISPRLGVTTIAIVVTTISLFQWRALYALDHPPLHRTNCVTCHSDSKTLRAMADKAGDPLYLVKRGDLKALPKEYVAECLCPDISKVKPHSSTSSLPISTLPTSLLNKAVGK